MVVASLILSKSFLLIITASFWLFFSVLPLIALSSSMLMNPAPVWTPPGNLLPVFAWDPFPKRVSSTPAWLLLWLARDYRFIMIKTNSKTKLKKEFTIQFIWMSNKSSKIAYWNFFYFRYTLWIHQEALPTFSVGTKWLRFYILTVFVN